MRRSDKKKSAGPKGQKPLTSFFYTKPKPIDSPVAAPLNAGRRAEARPSAFTPEDASCEVITLDDSPARPQVGSDASPRPSKRLKVDPQATRAVIPDSDADAEEAQPSTGSGSSPHRPQSRGQSSSIPARVPSRHQRFQSKLAAETTGRGRGKAVDGIVKQKHTPLELQVVELKKKHPGVILIFEVGYKFRFFGEDAETAASLCNIFCYPDRNFMTASIPVPRLHVYVRRLVAAGHKVGIVRQTETAALKAAGDNKYAPFTRKLTAVYTRSTLEAGLQQDIGEGGASTGSGPAPGAGSWSSEGLSNYLVCLTEEPAGSLGEVEIGVVAVETSAGNVLYGQFRDTTMRSKLEAHLMFAVPSELLVAQPVSDVTQRLLGGFSQSARGLKAEAVPGSRHNAESAAAAVAAFFAPGEGEAGGPSLGELPPLVLVALAHALDYLQQFNLQAVLRQRCAFRHFREANEISLSPNALRQLEVLRNSSDGSERGSMLWLLDHTKTAMGGRLLRAWVAHPLRHPALINERLDAVEALAAGEGDEGSLLSRLRTVLSSMPDLERGVTRMLHGTACPAELLKTLTAFSQLPKALRLQANDCRSVQGVDAALLQRSTAAAASPEAADAAADMLSQLDAAAAERNDKVDLFHNAERFPGVAERRAALGACKAALAELLPLLARRLRVPRLEYKSIMNQGDYLIEVDVDRTDIPKDWEKVSSTKKSNRFRPPEVTAAMRQLEISQERLQAEAEAAYAGFLADVTPVYLPLRAAATALATLDVLQSLALVSGNAGYVRPQFVEEGEAHQVHIVGGRHPVLDAMMDAPYVPNDTHLGGAGRPTAELITGPNMGGKSSYIRQVALIAIMAQIGSWVPADEVRLRAIDAVHTRMGASDDLARGRSTFLEELLETSAILAAATPASLVVIDELGRGTSTHDGLAIAHAAMHHLVAKGIPLLFVTHYPKVATLQESFPGRIATRYSSFLQDVPQQGGGPADEGRQQPPRITFLYKLVPGVAGRSFGLNVARMAQLPECVVSRAAAKAEAMEHLAVHRSDERVAALLAKLWALRAVKSGQLEELKQQQTAVRSVLQ